MTYQVKYEEYRTYFLTFLDKAEFEEWEDSPFINELQPEQVNLSKLNIDVTELEEDE
jgi:hypothetical protein